MIGFRLRRRGTHPDREPDDLPLGCVLMIAAPIALVVSSILVYQEVRYLLHGMRAEANVDALFKVTNPRGPQNLVGVRYTFTDPATGRSRTEIDQVVMGWEPAGATVEVQFLPGSAGNSRIAGHRHYLAIVVFFAILGATAAIFVYFLLDARRALGETPHRGPAHRTH